MRYTATILMCLLLFCLSGCTPTPDQQENATDVIAFLTAQNDHDYARVDPAETPSFPRDHGVHPGFRQEWWYYTAVLESSEGRRYGVQLTFFRLAHGRQTAYGDVSWNHGQSWMAHLVLSDLERRRLMVREDFSRQAAGLTGAQSEPFAVWLNGWSVRQLDAQCEDCLEYRLSAAGGGMEILLMLRTDFEPVLHGEQGFSAKTGSGEVASYYYSYPDLQARGRLRLGDQVHEVTGSAWMDHEWSTDVLSREQAGWDWFGIRLSDGRSLMLFQVRDELDGGFTAATLVGRDRKPLPIRHDDIDLKPVRWWKSDISGAVYPVAWRLEIASLDLNLQVEAAFEAQEVDLAFRYWEGVIDVRGDHAGRRVHGEGYMELTGYGVE